MALPKIIVIKETEKEIKQLLKTSSPFIAQRLRVILILKQHESTGISKREASTLAGVCPGSIQKWRTLYLKDGIEGIMKHNKIGYKPSVFTLEERSILEQKLNNPENGLRGYVELKEWIKQEFGKDILYRTVVNYCVTNFQSSVKVARKSHVNKDMDKVEDFKKTLDKSAKKSGIEKDTNLVQ
jgi:transposase